jgi:excisionase family DNA binding protein
MPIEIKLSEEDKRDIIDGVADALRNRELEPIRTYTVEEAARILNVTIGTVRNHIKKNILLARRTGKNYIITEENLKNYINGK